MSNLAQLKKMKAAWKNARSQANSVSDWEDGEYKLKLTKASLGTSEAGRFQCKMEWKFLDGQYEGKTYNEYQGLVDEQNMTWFARRLAQLGYEVENMEPEDIEKWCKGVPKDGVVVEAKLVTKGDYQNLRITGVVEGDEGESEESEDEDEKPKGKKGSKAKAEPEEEEVEEEAEEEIEWKKGMKCRVKDGKKTVEGEIKKIKGDTVTVETDDSELECELSDLMPVEEEEEEEEEEKPKGKKGKKPEPEEEEEVEEGEVSVDDEVSFTAKGKKHTGTVIDVDDEYVRVRSEKDDKVYKLKKDAVDQV